MDFGFTPEQEIFRRTVREFADRVIRPRIPEMEETKEIPLDILDEIAAQGYYGLRYPEEIGGQGGDNVLFAIFVEEMARCYVSTAARAMMQCLMGTDFVYRLGSEGQKQEFLIPLASGQIIGAFAFLSGVRQKQFFQGYIMPALVSLNQRLQDDRFDGYTILRRTAAEALDRYSRQQEG